MTTNRNRIVLAISVCLLLAGVFLRLYNLGEASYQIDELATMQMWMEDNSLSDIMDHALRDLHWAHRMPMLPIINQFIIRNIRYDGALPPEWLGRLPHAVLGILALPLFFGLGRRLAGERVGLWSLFLATFSLFAVYYAREAYDYSMLIFFSLGALWAGLGLVREGLSDGPIRWRTVLSYVLFSTGLILNHLSGLLFLAPWTLLIVLFVLRFGGWRRFLTGTRPLAWVLSLGVAFVCFFPFLLRLMGGYTSADTGSNIIRFSWAVFPALLGRMGWGERWPVMLPHVAILCFAIPWGRLDADRAYRRLAGLLAIQWLVYFAVQSYLLRVSRFEVRYYAPMFPILIVFTAVGLERFAQWAGAKTRRISAPMVRGALAAVLLLWLIPSLYLILEMGCRAANYKGVARWIVEHVPEGGTYMTGSIYDMRGVPGVYPTPGRNHSFLSANSTDEDNRRDPHVPRAISMFTRFPQVYFIDIAPQDEPPGVPVIPVERLFARHGWVYDEPTVKLFHWKTMPSGETQVSATNVCRFRYAYNLPEDMPGLAAQRGDSFYHYFGPEWQFHKDRMQMEWMVTKGWANLYLGSLKPSPVTVDLKLKVAGVPEGCRLSMVNADGVAFLNNRTIPNALQDLALTNLTLTPGTQSFRVNVQPPAGRIEAYLMLYSLEIVEKRN